MRLRLHRQPQPHGVQHRKQTFDLRIAPFRKHPVETFPAQFSLLRYGENHGFRFDFLTFTYFQKSPTGQLISHHMAFKPKSAKSKIKMSAISRLAFRPLTQNKPPTLLKQPLFLRLLPISDLFDGQCNPFRQVILLFHILNCMILRFTMFPHEKNPDNNQSNERKPTDQRINNQRIH
jgi:hypothetical protein